MSATVTLALICAAAYLGQDCLKKETVYLNETSLLFKQRLNNFFLTFFLQICQKGTFAYIDDVIMSSYGTLVSFILIIILIVLMAK